MGASTFNMAAPHNADDDFDINLGTREEDWPDPDVDSSTEEGAEAVRRSEAAMDAAIERMTQKRRRQCRTQQPADGETNGLAALYIKARDRQDQLTDEERHLLLGRGDFTGRVLGAFDSLTTAEVYEFLALPTPDVVRTNVQRVTGGVLSTVAELSAKVKDAVERGRFEELVSIEEVRLIMNKYHVGLGPLAVQKALYARLGVPGNTEAFELVARRLGFRDPATNAALRARHEANPPPPLPPPPPRPAPDPEFLLHLARLKTDRDSGGTYMWPQIVQPRNPRNLFYEDTDFGGYDLEIQWNRLAEQEREVYRARSAEIRRESWAKFETFLAGRARGVPTPEVQLQPSFPPDCITAFELFRDSLGSGLGFWDVLQRWEGLSESTRRAYGKKTVPLNAAVLLAFRQRGVPY